MPVTTDTTLPRRLVAEALGTAFLLAAVVGSGIMGERLSGGNVAIALLANSLATGTVLAVLILVFGPISGAHFNPAVTLADASQRRVPWHEVLTYVAVQIAGAFAGVAAANVMFGEPLFAASTHARAGAAQAFSEFIATFGLLLVIQGCSRSRPGAIPFAVGAYGRLLVHRLHILREPGRDAGARCHGNVLRHPPGRRAGFPARAADRHRGCHWSLPLARPAAGAGGVSRASPRRARPRRSPMKTVIFACVHNAGRSQLAVAFFNEMTNPALARAVSAGTRPAARVHPEVVEAMREVGIEVGAAKPQLLTPQLAQGAQLLITMGCGDECPVVPGLRREDWPLEDPKGQSPAKVREIRDEIRGRVWQLIAREGWWKLRPAPFLKSAG